ncbi:hypothetical protein [Brevundimonas sp.]|uniref:hypothetical protein n=1 Tax=Brevundimonas sp. TaxID=1871086 RepID=UPI0025CC8403|nr:hypothetical protein [Brevundimonas sp.]
MRPIHLISIAAVAAASLGLSACEVSYSTGEDAASAEDTATDAAEEGAAEEGMTEEDYAAGDEYAAEESEGGEEEAP